MILLLVLLVLGGRVAAQKRFNVMMNTGLGKGEIYGNSWYIGGEFNYNIFPYIGVLLRAESYERIDPNMHRAQMNVIVGQPVVLETPEYQIVDRKVGTLRFYGVGLFLDPLGFWLRDIPHVVQLAGGMGYANGYLLRSEWPDLHFSHRSFSELNYFLTLRYRYRLTESFSLGAQVNYLATSYEQLSFGVSCSFDI